MELLNQIPTADMILDTFRAELGRDFDAYKNHVYRVIHYCTVLSPGLSGEDREKLAIAAAFHDLGIWYRNTFDYLEPSASMMKTYLAQTGLAFDKDELRAIIENHHKIRPCTNEYQLAELFRKADWIDVTWGLIGHSTPPSLRNRIKKRFPNSGFHKRLVQLFFKRCLSHPFDPLPMMRWYIITFFLTQYVYFARIRVYTLINGSVL